MYFRDVPSLNILLQLILVGFSEAFDLGITYHYKYVTNVFASENCSGASGDDAVGHQIQAKISFTTLWQDPQNVQHKLFQIRVLHPKLLLWKKSAFHERPSIFQSHHPVDSFFTWSNNKVEKFWDSSNEDLFLKNIKRSVASLLQIQKYASEGKEVDISGTCSVLYKTEGNVVKRSKGNCYHPAHTVASQPYGVRSSTVQHYSGSNCIWENESVLKKCEVTEYVRSYSNLWRKASTCIESTSEFTYEGSTNSEEAYKAGDLESLLVELRKKQKADLVKGSILAVFDSGTDRSSHQDLSSIKGFQESLKSTNLAKLKSASAFFKVLPVFRSASTEDITKFLTNKKWNPVMPQIMDILAASATESSVEAVVRYFSAVNDYDELLERYLLSLSVLPKPSAFILKSIKDILKKGNHHEKIEASLFATLGTLLKTYAKTSNVQQEVVEDIRDTLEEALKACKNENCILLCLRGLRNAAQPKSIPLIVEYFSRGGKPALEALLAIRCMPYLPQSQELPNHLLKVFLQIGQKQDRSARAIAAEILLQKYPEDDILRSILKSLGDQSDVEFSTFLASKILRLSAEDETLRHKIQSLLPEKHISHYYSLSQKGKSSLFKKQLLSTGDLNITYGIEMELLQGGLLKRSMFDVHFERGDETSNLLSVGMFAGGLSSLAGSESSSSEEEGDPTAGMELTLLGSSLRPYIFFSGTSELMSHAWSGTASELTPALQGIFLLSDDNHVVILQNGMTVKTDLRAAMSTDLSAAIQVSLWSRNSQSQVRNAAALLAKGSACVDAGFVKTRGDYQFYGQSEIDFSTELEFYEAPFKMCLQMEHPDIQVKHDFQKSVELPETKFSTKKTKRRKRFIPSRSFALHHNNNELCRIMKGSQTD